MAWDHGELELCALTVGVDLAAEFYLILTDVWYDRVSYYYCIVEVGYERVACDIGIGVYVCDL